MKKILAIAAVLILLLTLAVPAFAVDNFFVMFNPCR